MEQHIEVENCPTNKLRRPLGWFALMSFDFGVKNGVVNGRMRSGSFRIQNICFLIKQKSVEQNWEIHKNTVHKRHLLLLFASTCSLPLASITCPKIPKTLRTMNENVGPSYRWEFRGLTEDNDRAGWEAFAVYNPRISAQVFGPQPVPRQCSQWHFGRVPGC